MNNYNKLLNNLENLNLIQFKSKLDEYIDLINNKRKSVVESLYELTKFELEIKKARAMKACVKVANFSSLKTFSDFDFTFQPSLNKEAILDLKELRFLEKKENILFLGNSGTGKSHLATSIGIECAENRYSTYFINCHDLCNQLKKAFLENRLESKIKNYAKYRVFIIDEVGYLPIDKDTSNMFFQLIAKRYEKNTTIITTNCTFSKWSEIFGCSILANAILDRLLHHSIIFNITGKSYRTYNKLESSEKIKKTK